MKLNLLTFSDIIASSAAAVQSASNRLLDLSTGSVLRAVLEANGSIVLWMQWLIVSVLRTTRASSSTGMDLDSWMADFAFTRLPAAPAVGHVSFSRFSASTPSSISPGVLVKTSDGSQSFAVTVDPTNAAWNSVTSRYILGIGSSSIEVPVLAQIAGSAGNVQAGTISVIASPIIGVDAVSNNLATASGVDGEADTDFRTRFVAYINSRSRSTPLAIKSAILEVQQGLSYAVQENIDTSGSYSPGNFLLVIDDGSGSPSPTLLAAINAAVERVRPIGSIFSVRAPVITPVAVSLKLTLAPGANTASIGAAVTLQITQYVNSLPIGASFPATRAAQLAYDCDRAIINVGSVLLNGLFSDVLVSPTGVVKIASVSVS